MVSSALSSNICYQPFRRTLNSNADNDLVSFVGKVSKRHFGAGGGHEHVYQYADDWPELLNYKVPLRYHSNELTVLYNYLSARRTPRPPELALADYADKILQDCTPRTFAPPYASGPLRPSDVYKAFGVGAMDKSPGYPLYEEFKTKGEALFEVFPDLYFALHVRILCLLKLAPHCETWQDYQDCFCVDPFSFSIKNEVIKVAKDGRYLIAFGYVDAALENLLFWPVTDATKDTRFTSYSAIGLGFDEHTSTLINACFDDVDRKFKSDMPTFDGGVSLEELIRVTRIDMRSMGISSGEWMSRVAISHEIAMHNNVIILSNGDVVKPVMGIGNTPGRPRTSDSNTKVRARRSFLVDLVLGSNGSLARTLPLCAGDDACEDDTPLREQAYNFVGYPLRDAETVEVLEFCSFIWESTPYGVRLDKALFNLLKDAPIDKEKWAAFVSGFQHHPRFGEAANFVLGRRPEMKEIMNALSTERVAFAVKYDAHAKKRKPNPKPTRPLVVGKGDYTTADRDAIKSLQTAVAKLDKKIPEISGGSIGKSVGKLFGRPELGEKLGSGLASVFGFGDYDIKSNSLVKAAGNMSAASVPMFGKDGKRGVRITEREFLGDVRSGTLVGAATAFTNTTFRVNPADSATFPWLSTIATMFDQYEPHGIVFEYVATSSEYNGTSQALGTVILAADYDVTDTAYTNKLEMENADYSNSTKSSETAMHGIECDPAERPTKLLFVGTPSATSNAQMYDLCNFQIATSGMSTTNVTLGELWVSYDFTFYKKQLTGGYGSQTKSAIWTSTTTDSTTSMIGTATADSHNDPTFRVAQEIGVGTRIYLPPNQFAGRYLIVYTADWASGSLNLNNAATSPVNCTSISTELITPALAAAGEHLVWRKVIEINNPGATLLCALSLGNLTNAKLRISMVPSWYT